jgi:DNA polymerase/3'-5' exonuclease PolX
MEYKKAHSIAIDLLRKFEKCCSQCDIAGSVRREKPEVKDIELMAVPLLEHTTDLFGTILATERSKDFCKLVKSLGVILKGKVEDGRYVQIALKDGINLDLFIPQESDYVRQFIFRTGSADYSHKIIATACLKKGWCGTSDGMRLVSECSKVDVGGGKHKWKCHSKQPTLPPVFEDEYHFFKFFDLQWIEPKNRNV